MSGLFKTNTAPLIFSSSFSLLLLSFSFCSAQSFSRPSVSSLPASRLFYNAIRVIGSVSSSPSIRLSSLADVPFEPSFVDPTNSLWFDPDRTYQEILGFGGAITDAATGVISKLPEKLQEQIAQAYFGNGESGGAYTGSGSNGGNRYSLGRVHINSCDFSPYSYSFDDTPDDFALAHFDSQLVHDNFTIIPFIHRALAVSSSSSSSPADGDSSSGLRLFATPWSPPAWMKTSEQMTGSSVPCLKPEPAYHTVWAQYLVKFFESYANEYGIRFWGLTVQNEPEYAAPWEACTYTAEEERDFVKQYLGPIMRSNVATKDINIIAFDHNKDHVADWADVIYADQEASQFLWGIGVHWYSGDEFDHLQSTHDRWPGKHIFASESCNCPGVLLNDWSRAEKYAHDIIGDLNHWVEGWTDWNIVLDQTGGPNHLGNLCDAPIIAHLDQNPPTLTYQPTYFILGHFSRFLPPGAKRLHHDMSDWDGKVELVCFLVDRTQQHGGQKTGVVTDVDTTRDPYSVKTSDQEVVIIVLNEHDQDSVLKVKVKNQAARVVVPKHSILTLTFDAALL